MAKQYEVRTARSDSWLEAVFPDHKSAEGYARELRERLGVDAIVAERHLDQYVCTTCETEELSPVDILPKGWSWVDIDNAFREPLCASCLLRQGGAR